MEPLRLKFSENRDRLERLIALLTAIDAMSDDELRQIELRISIRKRQLDNGG